MSMCLMVHYENFHFFISSVSKKKLIPQNGTEPIGSIQVCHDNILKKAFRLNLEVSTQIDLPQTLPPIFTWA